MLNFMLMIGNPNTLAVLLKEVSKSENFDAFSKFVFQLFDWLGADAVFLRIEEFNKKYYQTYFIHFPGETLRNRIHKGEEDQLLKDCYPKIEHMPYKPMVISVNKPEVNHVEVQVCWKEDTDFERLRAEIELLHPVLTIKMEQLQLAQNLGKYEQMLANSMDVMMLIEKDELEYVSPQAHKFMGYDIDELRKAVVSQNILNPRDQVDVRNKIRHDENLKREYSKREYKVGLKDGSSKWIEWVVRRIFDENGDVLRMILNFRDISGKKKAEEELEHQKAYLQEILDRLPIDIFMKDQNGQYIFVNSTAANTVDLRMQDIIGKTDKDIFDKETAAHNQSTDLQVFKGEVISEVHSVPKKDKEVILLTNKQAVKVEDRQVILGYSVDITEQQSNERKLKESTEFINRSLQIVPDSIFIFDIENWTYVFTNNKIFDKLGYTDKDVKPDLKSFIRKIIYKEDVETYFHQMDEIREGQKDFFELEYRVYDKNGKVRWLFSRKAPIKKDEKGRIQQYVGITFDITEQKIREENLIKTRGELESALQSREEFLSVMSHEIRTPLNAIIGIAGLLGEGSALNDQQEMVKVLKSSGENLLLMINDILDFSKIRAGQLQFDLTAFEIKKLVKSICMSYYAQIRDKGLEFDCSIDPAVPDYLHGDSLRLNQILNNLLSNAVKFTSEGRIDSKVRLSSETEKELELEFLITDTGIGIPDGKKNSIFNPFQQVSSKTTRKYGGTGLGLSITKELIERQGGTLKVESELNTGSTFSVKMKFGKVKPEEIKKSENKTTHFEPFKENDFKILYVEDVSSNRFLMQAYCKQWNLELITCNSGKEALEIIKDQDFNLILMDIQMPEMDGFETMKRMKDTYGEIPPVVALSADVSHSVAKEIEKAGMRDYITKPIQVEVLYGKLREILLAKIVRRNQKITEKTAIDNQSIHRTLLGIYGNNVEEYQTYLHQVNIELNQSRDDIKNALQQRDLGKFREARHKLIGPIGIFNLHDLQEFLDNMRFDLEHDKEGLDINLAIQRVDQTFEETTSGLLWDSMKVAEAE